jgi:hypothetical protein
MDNEKKTPKRERKDEWLGKPRDQWTEEDKEDYADFQKNPRPLRFFFGKDTTDEDIDAFLDILFGEE